MSADWSGFSCQECGHKFRTLAGAEKAMMGPNGCPKCGGADIDMAPEAYAPLDLTPQARDARMIEPGCQRIESELSHLFGER